MTGHMRVEQVATCRGIRTAANGSTCGTENEGGHVGISALWEQEGEGDAPPPRRGDLFLDHAEALIGVEELVRSSEDPDMLRDGAGLHAKEDQRARNNIRSGDLRHHAPSPIRKNLARAGLAPVAAVGRDRERFRADDLTPDAPGEPKAIASDALETGLVVIRRAEPGPRDGYDVLRIYGLQSTAPSCPPSLVA